MNQTPPTHQPKRRTKAIMLGGAAYALGYIVLSMLVWADFNDRWLMLESIVSHTAQLLLYSVYAPVAFVPFQHSVWIFPYLLCVGCGISWIGISARAYFKNRKSHATSSAQLR